MSLRQKGQEFLAILEYILRLSPKGREKIKKETVHLIPLPDFQTS